MNKFEVDSCIRGFHIYKETWTPSLGGEHDCQRERGNPQDPYAVAVMHRRLGVVGNVPRLISAACSLFLRRDTSTIKCRITGSRRYSSDLMQGGLEVPCKLIFRGDQKEIAKVKKLVLPITTERQVSQKNSQSNKKLKLVVPEVIDVDAVVVANGVAPKQWLNRNGIMVTECDKNVIMEGEQLTDKHINFAQQILKNHFTNLSGLQSTLLLAKSTRISNTNMYLQIFHDRDSHWIVVSTIGSKLLKVYVYDSVYSSIDQHTKKLIMQLLGDVDVELQSCPKQRGSDDCGLYAIAICTSLAHGHQPTAYIQETMQNHLVKCFEENFLAVFP